MHPSCVDKTPKRKAASKHGFRNRDPSDPVDLDKSADWTNCLEDTKKNLAQIIFVWTKGDFNLCVFLCFTFVQQVTTSGDILDNLSDELDNYLRFCPICQN